MTKPKAISDSIEKIWIIRDYIDAEWRKNKNASRPIMLVGPARTGKHSLAKNKFESDNFVWETIQDIDRNRDLIKDPSSTAAIFIDFPDYRAIQTSKIFFYRLQTEILSQFSKRIFHNDELVDAFIEKKGFRSESAVNFFQIFNELLNRDNFYYPGRINIYLCGIQYIFADILKSLLEYLRAFVDSVTGDQELERFKLILTSLCDGYHLTEARKDIYSPLACAARIYISDFRREEFNRFINKLKSDLQLAIKDTSYLYSLTNGDIYFTKVILSYCDANAIYNERAITGRKKIITNELIDKAVDFILYSPNLDCNPPFQFLRSFITQYADVRDVLYALNAGADMADMTDTSGVYTLPESSGAVIKIEKKGKYGYIFRNEIYRRFVELYIKTEEKKVESIIFESIGKGDFSLPGTLASAIRHEMGGPINVITAELSRLLSDPQMSKENVECLNAIQEANIRLSTMDSFLKDMWSQEPNLETIDLNEYIEKNFSIFKGHLSRRKIKLIFKFDPKIKALKLDSSALRLALINLIINARDAILKKGSGTITIETKYKSNEHIEIFVKDDGIGMDKYTIHNIMNCGFSTKHDGQGIGLTICKTALNRMKAEINVESKLNKGTTFIVTLRSKKNEKETNTSY